jgi:hypothetical protein
LETGDVVHRGFHLWVFGLMLGRGCMVGGLRFESEVLVP